MTLDKIYLNETIIVISRFILPMAHICFMNCIQEHVCKYVKVVVADIHTAICCD